MIVATPELKKISLRNLSNRFQIRYSRTNGWELYLTEYKDLKEELVAGEFLTGGLYLEYNNHILVDTLEEQKSE